MRIDVFTVFPEMFPGPLGVSIIGRAVDRGLISIAVHNLRDACTDRHRVTDDMPYGGGAGMVMKPEPIFESVERVLGAGPDRPPVVLLTPQGRRLDHSIAAEYAERGRCALVCGHYEGVDERVREHLVTDEVSLGDYVLTGGELAAMVFIDAVCRLVPGVLGRAGSAQDDSFAHGLLEFPQYTRPPKYRGWSVPEVLLSGHHAEIAKWRRREALRRTLQRRPDLLARAALSDTDQRLLREFGQSDAGQDRQDR